MEGIGRALGNTFGGHWWGIGGHWRALVVTRHKNAHIDAHNAHSEKYTNTYDDNEKKTFPCHEMSLIYFCENPGDQKPL